MPKFRFKLKLRESEQLVQQTLFKFQKEEPSFVLTFKKELMKEEGKGIFWVFTVTMEP